MEERQSLLPKTRSRTWFLYFAATIANLTAFVCGISFSWTSPILPKLSRSDSPLGRPITTTETSWITGSINIGSLIGPIVAGRITDKLGRKKALIIMACPMAVSQIIAAFAGDVRLFYLSRLLMGVGRGGTLIALPIYLAEIADNHNRGKITSFIGIFIALGMLFPYITGPFTSVRNFSLACAVPALVFLPVFAIWMPETPHFYALAGNRAGVEKSLKKLKKEEEIHVDKNERRSGFKEILATKSVRKGFWIVLTLIVLQAFSGAIAIASYLQTIFMASGSSVSPEICAIVVAIARTFITLLMSVLVDKLGRRFLILVSSVGSFVSLTVLGIYFYLKDGGVEVGSFFWLPVSSLLLYVFFINLGITPVPYILLVEMFPSHVKASASVLCSYSRTFCTFLTNFFFPQLAWYLGMEYSFWFFAFVSFITAIFSFKFLPETKGKSQLEIQKILEDYQHVQKKKPNYFLYLTACIACLSSFTAGILWVWTSPVLPRLDGTVDPENNPLAAPITPSQTSWITGLLSLGSFICPLLAGRMADKLGRKKSLLVISCPMLAALLLAAFADTVFMFCVARFLMGLGTGGVLTVLHMYLGEIAEDDNRGRITSLNSVFTSLGMLFTYVVGPFLSVRNFCLVCVLPLAVFMAAFFFWIPESPHFFALIDDRDGLKKSLLKLRREEEESVKIINTVERRTKTKSTFTDLFRCKQSRRALFLTLNVILLQIFCGSNAIFAYMQTIFAASGSKLESRNCPIVIASVQTLMIILSSSLVDKLGRRFLLLVSLLGCSVSLVALGGYFYLKNKEFDVDGIFWLPVTSLLVYVVFLSVGLRPVPFILQAEMFSPHVKASASILASLSRSMGNFTTTWCFPIVSAFLGMAVSFWIFAVICFLGAVSVFLTLPETKGKSFQEIQRILDGNRR